MTNNNTGGRVTATRQIKNNIGNISNKSDSDDNYVNDSIVSPSHYVGKETQTYMEDEREAQKNNLMQYFMRTIPDDVINRDARF